MPIKHLTVVKQGSGSSPRKTRPKQWRSLFGTLALTGFALVLIGFFVITLMLAWLTHDLPDPNALLTRDIAQSTKIFDRSGETLLYEIHGDEKRTLLKIEDIPKSMQWATIAIEDRGFYQHHGIYWRGLIRAFTIGLIKNQRVQGTSTLTQQFVKNALLTNERSLTRKLKELLLSIQIERKYTKDQILQLYLNEIPYGSTLYGVESAAQGYFGKHAKDLTLDESALLAALPQAPDIYNPYGTGSRGDNRELLIARQRTILDAMVAQEFISKDEADEAKKVTTLDKLIPKRVGDIRAPHFVMWVREQLNETYGQKTVETGGLRVITTLDWRLEQEAEKAVHDGVEKFGEQYGFTNAALAAIGPGDGHILAMVGSHDFFDEEHDGQVNVAIRPRQPGSSFKPMVYAAGFMKGFLPQTQLWDVDTVFRTEIGNYRPHNYDRSEHGPISIRNALQLSLNTPAVKMLYMVGVGRMLDIAEELGYTTLSDRSRFGLSLVLGGGEVKLLEHVAAYGTLATEGVRMPTTGILKVEGPDGSVLEEWKPSEGKRVFEPQITRLISNVLTDDAARAPVFGVGGYLTIPGRQVAAKTGTTDNYVDAWTVVYTPSLVAGVWAGNNDNKAMNRAGGSRAAAPIWNTFMRAATKGTPVETFTAPEPTTVTKPAIIGTAFERKVKVDSISGKLATELTPPEVIEERTFHDAHSILHYVDKDDPLGADPEDPSRDPQYRNWEDAVARWVLEKAWNATSTAPTEVDDVHTQENKPQVTISYPWENLDITSRSFTVKARAQANRRIVSLTAKMDGYVLGRIFASEGDITALIPNALPKGSHQLIVEARDDVGNAGSASIPINLVADQQPLQISFSDPAPGSTIKRADFPKTISININDLTNIIKVDLYLELHNGARTLVGSEIGPTASPITFQWTAVQSTGDYSLYAIATDKNNQSITSDHASIQVVP